MDLVPARVGRTAVRRCALPLATYADILEPGGADALRAELELARRGAREARDADILADYEAALALLPTSRRRRWPRGTPCR